MLYNIKKYLLTNQYICDNIYVQNSIRRNLHVWKTSKRKN